MSNWHYIGPDKTGFDCPDCCTAFSVSNGSCVPKSCQVLGSSVFRNYLCPNSSFPTPFHYYKITPSTGNASIAPNPKFCSTVSPSCYTYSPSTGLNAAGRIGTGCSQTYVTYTTDCYGSISSTCPGGGCDTACGYTQTGFIAYPKSCFPTPGGACSCVSLSSYAVACGCQCTAGPLPGGLCYQTFDPQAPCYVDPGNYNCIQCPDGSLACDGAACCNGAELPPEGCNQCEQLVCTGDAYTCSPLFCSTACSAGFTCSCGTCVCNTASTCCSGDTYGWFYSSDTRECISCGYNFYASREGCCDYTWKRKNCQAGSICCNDGRCYDESTTLCTIN